MLFSFIGYNYEYRDQWQINGNTHRLFTGLFYDSSPYLVENRFVNQYEISAGWVFARSSSVPLNNRSYLKARASHWLNIYNDWWLHGTLDFYQVSEFNSEYQNALRFGYWENFSSDFRKVSLAAFYDFTFLLAGVFSEYQYRGGFAFGQVNRVFWRGLMLEARYGYIIDSEAFIHASALAKF